MKTINPCTLFLSLFLVFPVLLSGQIPDDQFVSAEYRFTVGLPATPTEKKDFYIEILKEYDLFGEYILWNDVPGTFVSIGAYEVSGKNPTLTPAEKIKVIADYKKQEVTEYKESGMTIREVPFTFGAIKGTEVRGIMSTSKVVVRLFFLKDHLFVLSASKSSAPDFRWHLRMLNSFRILTKSEYIAALLHENTPEALPYAPRQARPANDLAHAALKGRVRAIIEEQQESLKSSREPFSETHYDPEGYLIRQIIYASLGYPSEITVWGWIDGMRVSDSRMIAYPLDVELNGKETTELIQSMPASPEDPVAPVEKKARDPRYTTRHEFKYDAQNRVVEKKEFGDDGELNWTENTTYGPDTRTTEHSSDFRKTRSVETIDPYGNVTEEKVFGADGKLESNYLYKYTLDTKGNWRIRRQSEKTIVKGKSVVKSGPTHFRTIAYYDSLF